MSFTRIRPADSGYHLADQTADAHFVPREILFQLSWAAVLGLICLAFATLNY